MKQYLIEVCANSVESARIGQEAGAGRIELCAGMPEGGTTPSYACIKMARQKLTHIPLHVIIRPRGGDFLYTPDEVAQMVDDITCARRLGADGIVIGCLDRDGHVDCATLDCLVAAAQGMHITFHRAFDVCNDPLHALEIIKRYPIERILTSGCKPTAWEGRDLLKQLVDKAGSDILIMPGCGVNDTNIGELAEWTGAHEFHLSGRTAVDSLMRYRRPEVSMGGTVVIDEYKQEITSAEKVRAALHALRG